MKFQWLALSCEKNIASLKLHSIIENFALDGAGLQYDPQCASYHQNFLRQIDCQVLFFNFRNSIKVDEWFRLLCWMLDKSEGVIKCMEYLRIEIFHTLEFEFDVFSKQVIWLLYTPQQMKKTFCNFFLRTRLFCLGRNLFNLTNCQSNIWVKRCVSTFSTSFIRGL